MSRSPDGRGGLGDSCEGAEGPDDSLCAGNLGCSPLTDETSGAVCGGVGAECLYTGSYVPGDVPNHQACLSGEYLFISRPSCFLTAAPKDAGSPSSALAPPPFPPPLPRFFFPSRVSTQVSRALTDCPCLLIGHCDSTSLTCARAPRTKINLSPAAQKKELAKQKKKKNKGQSQRLQQQLQRDYRQKQLQLEQQRLIAALHPPYAPEDDDEIIGERSLVDDEAYRACTLLSRSSPAPRDR